MRTVLLVQAERPAHAGQQRGLASQATRLGGTIPVAARLMWAIPLARPGRCALASRARDASRYGVCPERREPRKPCPPGAGEIE